jgi:hypothetical protein
MKVNLILQSCSLTKEESGKTVIIFNHCTANCCAGDKIEKNVMGGACSEDGGGERHVQDFWWRNLRERDNWEDPGLDGMIIIRWMFRKWDVGVWTGLGWVRVETGGEHL